MDVFRAVTPPFAPVPEWYARFLSPHEFETNDSDELAVSSNKELARCRIAGNTSVPLLLTIPIEGGAKMLKGRCNPDSLALSDHGNWKHVHLSAFEATYGRTPYFQHLFPALESVYKAEITTLAEFNIAIHRVILTFLLGETDSSSIGILFNDENKVLSDRGKEIMSRINPELSVVDALMRFGPETILGLPLLRK